MGKGRRGGQGQGASIVRRESEKRGKRALRGMYRLFVEFWWWVGMCGREAEEGKDFEAMMDGG